MNILTWNVNGLRAVLNKGSWEQVLRLSPDVICLQEIKTRPEQLSEAQRSQLDGYQIYWNPAQKPGYSGVATFLRDDSYQVKLGIDQTEYDAEGRVICTQFPDFWLYNVYFPSGQRGYARVEFKLRFYEALLQLLARHHSQGQAVVVCGDFNTAHAEIDLRNPKQNQKTSGFMPEERAWVDRYLEQGLCDVYRWLYPERVQYTWWTYVSNARQRNVGWRLDYFLVSETLKPRVRDVVIHDDIPGSDHCPVSLVID